MEVTINKVLYGVTKTLDTYFPDTTIYEDEIKVDLSPPAFFVKLLQSEQTQELGRRYHRVHSFDIHYFAPSKKNSEMHNMAEDLYQKMRLIDIDGKLHRGTGMNHEIVDQVLHFFVDYNFKVYDEKPQVPSMQTLDQEEGIKT